MSFHLRKPSSILTRIHSHILSRNRIQNFSLKRATLVEEYEPIIGLEVHAQLNTKSKLFSDAGSQFNARPNSQVASFDLSLPGSLPRLNQSAVIDAIRSGLALNCRIPEKSSFDRKHYFYADLPNGYQITQQREPIARDGYIDFIVYDDFHHTIGIQNPSAKIQPQLKRCYLKQIQLEQDSGKSLVDSEESLIDLNRAGLPLLEFVFEPELQSTLEATSLVRELIQILQLLKACTCRMELGALRVDANISVRPRGESKLGTRTEVKNLNSFRFLREAIEYEIQRQIQVLKSGGRVINETMGWDFRTKQTHSMRDKEIVQDYRFLPEPNLPPIFVGNCSMEPSLVESSKQSINIRPFIEEIESLNLPSKIRQQLEEECELSLQETHFLVANSELRELFLELFRNSEFKDGAFIFDIVFKLTNGLLDLTLEPLSIEVIRSKISVENFGEILALLHSGVISQQTSVDIVRLYQQGIQNKTPNEIVAEFNWSLVNDPVEIERICRIVVKELPKVAKKFAKSGERKPRSMLIQKAQLALGNRANEDQLWVVFEKILRPSSKL